MKHPNPLMLLRIAQGDSCGMATEYIKFPEHQATLDEALKFESYVKHPSFHTLLPGQYTDDTQMSIAVTEVLINESRRLLSEFPKTENILPTCNVLQRVFTDSFVRCFKRDPRNGYAKHFQAFLESVVDTDDFLARINPDSDRNGAAMRAVPIGRLPTEELVILAAGEQAKITHATSGGQGSAMLVALMSHYALWRDEPLSELRTFLANHFNMPIDDEDLQPWSGPVVMPDVGMKTARAVLTLLTTQTSLLDIARTALTWGGDTDSVLSIAWGIASARMTEPLPDFFERDLENGSYGKDFLIALGTQLMGEL